MSVPGNEWREVGCGGTPAAAMEQARAVLLAEGHAVPDEEFAFYKAADGTDGYRAFVRLEPEETQVERLTLVTEAGWLNFDPPVVLLPGEVFWTWGRDLHVRGVDNAVRQVQARLPRPTDRR